MSPLSTSTEKATQSRTALPTRPWTPREAGPPPKEATMTMAGPLRCSDTGIDPMFVEEEGHPLGFVVQCELGTQYSNPSEEQNVSMHVVMTHYITSNLENSP